MGFETVYGIGALVLLTALIFGVLQYHYRDRRAPRAGGEIARERYKRNETWSVVGLSRPFSIDLTCGQYFTKRAPPKLVWRIPSAGFF
jgi:hypothetical protein